FDLNFSGVRGSLGGSRRGSHDMDYCTHHPSELADDCWSCYLTEFEDDAAEEKAEKLAAENVERNYLRSLIDDLIKTGMLPLRACIEAPAEHRRMLRETYLKLDAEKTRVGDARTIAEKRYIEYHYARYGTQPDDIAAQRDALQAEYGRLDDRFKR